MRNCMLSFDIATKKAFSLNKLVNKIVKWDWVKVWLAKFVRWWYTSTFITRIDSQFSWFVWRKIGVWMSSLDAKSFYVYIVLMCNLILKFTGVIFTSSMCSVSLRILICSKKISKRFSIFLSLLLFFVKDFVGGNPPTTHVQLFIS